MPGEALDDAAFGRLIENREFMEFMQEQMGHYVSYGAFAAQRMPCGISPETAWLFLSFLRRMNGNPLLRDLSDNEIESLSQTGFSTTTLEMVISVREIVGRSNSQSWLWKSLVHMPPPYVLQRFMTEELACAAMRDGFRIDHEALRQVTGRKRPATDDGEQLVANAMECLMGLESWLERPYDSVLIEDLHSRICEGVSFDDIQAYSSPDTLVEIAHEYKSSPTGEILDEIASNSNGTYRWGSHQLFNILTNADIFWERGPFEQANAMTEVVYRCLSLIKADVPALMFVPLSKYRFDWELRLIGAPEAPFRFGEAIVMSDFGIDMTPYLLQMIAFLEKGLDALESVVGMSESKRNERKAAVAKDGRLNIRQAQIVSSLLDNPTAIIDVESYRSRFDVVSSTARYDLNKLVSFEYLATGLDGKKQVFWLGQGAECEP